jgi:hypothetical protein
MVSRWTVKESKLQRIHLSTFNPRIYFVLLIHAYFSFFAPASAPTPTSTPAPAPAPARSHYPLSVEANHTRLFGVRRKVLPHARYSSFGTTRGPTVDWAMLGPIFQPHD